MEAYWKNIISRVGRPALYVDTSAILGYFEQGDEKFREFIDTKALDYRFVTSTYVVVEVVRFLTKSKASVENKFVGPSDERCKQLSLHVLRTWLDEHRVHVICLPESEFDRARVVFRDCNYLACDLTDIISYMIVSSLEQQEILTGDRRHFNALGLMCLP